MPDIPESHRDILARHANSYVATVRPDGLLSVHAVSVLYDGSDTVRFSTKATRGKVRNLKADDRLSLCIPDPGNPMRYIELRGRATLAPDPDRAFIDRIAREFMGMDRYPYDNPGDQRVTVTLHIEQVAVSG
jgi:PPOX class probable F420-dependent enzyme